MTTRDVETNANVGGIADPDLDLKVLLRQKVLPEFMADSGFAVWRRGTGTLSTDIGSRDYTLPNDFGSMIRLCFGNDADHELTYIGEDAVKVAKAENNTAIAKPSGWYFTLTGDDSLFRIRLDNVPDQVYGLTLIYYTVVPFPDLTTTVNLNPYIPWRFQWALVEALQRQIYKIRFGVGDPRYQTSDAEYQHYIGMIQDDRELSRRNTPVFVK